MATTKKTRAEQVAAALSDDGRRWETDDGVSLDDLLGDAWLALVAEHRDAVRYEFADGSAIITSGECWDLGYSDTPQCCCMEGAGHDDRYCEVYGENEAF